MSAKQQQVSSEVYLSAKSHQHQEGQPPEPEYASEVHPHCSTRRRKHAKGDSCKMHAERPRQPKAWHQLRTFELLNRNEIAQDRAKHADSIEADHGLRTGQAKGERGAPEFGLVAMQEGRQVRCSNDQDAIRGAVEDTQVPVGRITYSFGGYTL